MLKRKRQSEKKNKRKKEEKKEGENKKLRYLKTDRQRKTLAYYTEYNIKVGK